MVSEMWVFLVFAVDVLDAVHVEQRDFERLLDDVSLRRNLTYCK